MEQKEKKKFFLKNLQNLKIIVIFAPKLKMHESFELN